MKVQEIAKYYKDFTRFLTPVSGRIKSLEKDSCVVEASFRLTDCENRRKLTVKKLYHVQLEGDQRLPKSMSLVSGPLGYQTSELAEAISNNGLYTARLIQAPNDESDEEKKQLLEIWRNEGGGNSLALLKSINVSKLEKHGNIVLEEPFMAFRWDTCGEQNRLLYTCHTKPKKHLSLFEEAAAGQEVDREFDRKEDWGETLSGIEHTVVGILSVNDNFSINVIDMAGYSLTNSQWLQGGRIVSEAIQENPRLGLVYCNNRPAIITVHNAETGELMNTLEDEGLTYNTLRVSNGADKMLISENGSFGPHHQPSRLKLYDADLKLISQLNKKPLFLDYVPEKCFTPDDQHILFAKSGDHLSLTLADCTGYSMLHTSTGLPTISSLYLKDNLMVVCASRINHPPKLSIASVKGLNSSTFYLEIPTTRPPIDKLFSYKMFHDIPTSDKKDTVSAILLKPQDPIIQPTGLTVFVVHGGPSNCYADRYYENFAFFVHLGMNVVLVNYRGSTDKDEAHLHKLTGKAGIMDVEDCSQVIRYFIKNHQIDPKKLAIMGGSHGGFLTGHLCAKGEFQFTSAVMINPVLDFPSSLFTTDIPEWVTEVALGRKYEPNWVPKQEDVTRMFSQSPIYQVGNCKIPTLMLLGSKDLRVKMYQGLRWVEHLKSQGVETCCKVYPDTHQLLNHQPDSMVTAATWLLEHSTS